MYGIKLNIPAGKKFVLYTKMKQGYIYFSSYDLPNVVIFRVL